MSDRKWPEEIVDAINRIGVNEPLTCGQNRCGFKMGCDEPLHDPADRYKCVECDVVFHRHCARKHFLDSGSEVEKLRERLLSVVAAFRRNDKTLTLDLLEELIRS